MFAKLFKRLRRSQIADPGSKADQPATSVERSIAATQAEELKEQGNRFLVDGALAQAEECYRQAICVDPLYAEAINNLGAVLRQQGQHADARSHFEEAIRLKPSLANAYYNLGTELSDQGDLIKAAEHLSKAIELNPNFPPAYNELAQAQVRRGEPGLARQALREGLEANPDFAEFHLNLGNLYRQEGELAKAIACYDQALVLKPDYAAAYSNLGLAQQGLGQLDEAVASYRQALKHDPVLADAHCHLGNALQDLRQLGEAVASYRQALRIKPDYAEAYSNLGLAQQGLRQLDEAVASYRQALKHNPVLADAHCNLGNALQELRQLDDAAASYRQALRIKPDYVLAHNNLGNALHDLGQLDAALASYRLARGIKPDYAEVNSNLGITLRELRLFDEAATSCRQALSIKPDFADAYNNLGNALQDLGQLADAVVSYRRALAIKQDFFNAHNNLGYVLQFLGHHESALASYRRALAIKPGDAEASSNLLFCLSHIEAVNGPELFAEHCRVADQVEAPLRATWPRHSNSRDPERCLQVGFVSADLRNHAVATFIEPLLAHLADLPQLSMHAYYNHAVEDDVTRRLKGYLSHWHPIVGLSDEALAQKIRGDGIDILFDLSGHTGKHRLLCFARKPAPLQISWIGYPGTTGLKAMDYYLSDHFFLPPGQFDDQFTEKIVRLPASAPFLPSREAPAVNALPALSKGHMTFGSFNRPDKINRSVIALWSQLLRALPNARMLLAAMPQASENNILIEWFSQEGIVRERLSFHSHCPMRDYLGLYNQVDLCLDTFPYNGGTTTLYALWMGVPVLTLAGGTVPGRCGAAVLSHAGLENFVAHSKTEFVEKGVQWAGQFAELANIRDRLRERVGQSAVCHPTAIAAALERALRIMWQRWCAGLPPESFEAPQPGMSKAVQEA